jgi:hypothetical protein
MTQSFQAWQEITDATMAAYEMSEVSLSHLYAWCSPWDKLS